LTSKLSCICACATHGHGEFHEELIEFKMSYLYLYHTWTWRMSWGAHWIQNVIKFVSVPRMDMENAMRSSLKSKSRICTCTTHCRGECHAELIEFKMSYLYLFHAWTGKMPWGTHWNQNVIFSPVPAWTWKMPCGAHWNQNVVAAVPVPRIDMENAMRSSLKSNCCICTCTTHGQGECHEELIEFKMSYWYLYHTWTWKMPCGAHWIQNVLFVPVPRMDREKAMRKSLKSKCRICTCTTHGHGECHEELSEIKMSYFTCTMGMENAMRSSVKSKCRILPVPWAWRMPCGAHWNQNVAFVPVPRM
jgi:hypothetical protein